MVTRLFLTRFPTGYRPKISEGDIEINLNSPPFSSPKPFISFSRLEISIRLSCDRVFFAIFRAPVKPNLAFLPLEPSLHHSTLTPLQRDVTQCLP